MITSITLTSCNIKTKFPFVKKTMKKKKNRDFKKEEALENGQNVKNSHPFGFH